MTTTALHQTLGAGTSAPRKWAASLAPRSDNKPRPLGKLQGMLVGPYGNGKSVLIQSNPDMFIVNADGFSAHIDNPQATMWPAAGESITFEDIVGKVGVLTKMAQKNEPRPETVAFDGLPGLIEMGKGFLVRRYNVKNPASKIDSWADLVTIDRTQWYKLYAIIQGLRSDLRAAGYGTWYLAGLSKKNLNMGQDMLISAVEWPFSDTLANDILSLSEIVVPIVVDWREVIDPETKRKSFVGDRYAHFTDPTMAGIAKAMSITEKIALPKGSGWQALEAAYNKANGLT